MTRQITDVIIIGGGPAGMMSAVAAGEGNVSVLLIEKNEKLGKKLFITGHGRCNVTNVSDRQTYERKIFRNSRFMRSALSRFTPDDLVAFLENYRVPVKQEESGRIFPASDKSSDIIRAFRKALEERHIHIELDTVVRSIDLTKSGEFCVRTSHGSRQALSVVLATGGVSYPSTGSTGDGLIIAEHLGHSSTALWPGLAGLICPEIPSNLSGLTVRNGEVMLLLDGKTIAEEDGDILFTHYGLSGPAVFRAVCALADQDTGRLEAWVNLAGGETEEQLVLALTEAASARGNEEIRSIVAELVPRRVAAHVLDSAGVEQRKKVNQMTRAERTHLAHAMVRFPLLASGPRPIEEAIVTIGGVPTNEIVPSTMASRIVPGLYFAGEIVDVSAYTGGYNLQIAFSSGKAAGMAAAEYAREHRYALKREK